MSKFSKKIAKSFEKFLEDVGEDAYDFLEEIWEEFLDFVEDFYKDIFRKKVKRAKKLKKIKLYGTFVSVRPAYAFAERVENLLKIIFGGSIIVSSAVASFWGFTGLSDLLKILIGTIFGRIVMIVIGFSYFTVGIWKTFYLKK